MCIGKSLHELVELTRLELLRRETSDDSSKKSGDDSTWFPFYCKYFWCLGLLQAMGCQKCSKVILFFLFSAEYAQLRSAMARRRKEQVHVRQKNHQSNAARNFSHRQPNREAKEVRADNAAKKRGDDPMQKRQSELISATIDSNRIEAFNSYLTARRQRLQELKMLLEDPDISSEEKALFRDEKLQILKQAMPAPPVIGLATPVASAPTTPGSSTPITINNSEDDEQVSILTFS